MKKSPIIILATIWMCGNGHAEFAMIPPAPSPKQTAAPPVASPPPSSARTAAEPLKPSRGPSFRPPKKAPPNALGRYRRPCDRARVRVANPARIRGTANRPCQNQGHLRFGGGPQCAGRLAGRQALDTGSQGRRAAARSRRPRPCELRIDRIRFKIPIILLRFRADALDPAP